MKEHGTGSSHRMVFVMILVIAIPALITLASMESPSRIVYSARTPNPSPLGYTWSLLLFIVPLIVMKLWFIRHPQYHIQKRAYLLTVSLLTPAGFLLDLFFGDDFLTFDNQGATLGLRLPAYAFGRGWVPNSIPVEEFVFYFTGFLTILLLYIWCDLYWLRHYHLDEYEVEAQKSDRAIRIHSESAVLGLVLIPVSVLYKRYGPHPYHEGFPGYFVFLVLFAVLPSMLFFESTRAFINWRAFSMSLFLVLLVSLLWEATLGVPYAWWGYRMESMMGITVYAWANLPIEAIILWVAVTWATVIVYELTSKFFHSKKDYRMFLLGRNNGD